MSKEITTGRATSFSLVPETLEEAMKYSKMIAESDIVPKDFKGRPANVLVAIQMGAELGLPPLQSLQNIAVINGKPSVYGDSLIAICRAHPSCEYIHESFDQASLTATCVAKRRGAPEQIKTFSKQDAEVAGLWGRQGPWKQFPERMLQMRARGFCLRDVFADALRGIQLAEEVRDYPQEKDITPEPEPAPNATKAETLGARLEAKIYPEPAPAPAPAPAAPVEPVEDPADVATYIRQMLTEVETAGEWNEVASLLAEKREMLGGRYPNLKKKCMDRREELAAKSAPPPAPAPAPDSPEPTPYDDPEDPGF